MNFQELHDNEFQELHDITKITLYYIKTYEFQESLDITDAIWYVLNPYHQGNNFSP
jgi:hypothetical protein